MTKVCHMTSAHPPEDVRIFFKECTSLAQFGYEVYMVSQGESYDKNGVHIIGIGEIPQCRIKRMTQGAKRVYEKALELDCDIYHFHDPELLPFGRKLKKNGKKVIYDIHESTVGTIMEKQYIPRFLRTIMSKAFSIYEKNVCRALDALVTVTPTQTEYYRRINSHTFEITNYPILSDELKRPTFERKAIVFAGGISEQWNHSIIIQALESLQDAEYVLCGRENSYLEKLKTLPAWNQVDYLGKIPHKEVSAVMSKCMIGVALLTPGRNTAGNIGTMGNTKIFEEMMAGLPVICTEFTLWKEFVERYHCGICIKPNDKTALINAVRYLLEHPAEAEKMGQNGQKAVAQEFNWETIKGKLLDLYAQLS